MLNDEPYVRWQSRARTAVRSPVRFIVPLRLAAFQVGAEEAISLELLELCSEVALLC